VEYFNLYGISFKVDGDIKKARERAYLANKLMFQTKMQNVNELDIISNSLRLDDGTIVNVMSQHGLDTANIYVPPEPVKEEIIEIEEGYYFVPGICMITGEDPDDYYDYDTLDSSQISVCGKEDWTGRIVVLPESDIVDTPGDRFPDYIPLGIEGLKEYGHQGDDYWFGDGWEDVEDSTTDTEFSPVPYLGNSTNGAYDYAYEVMKAQGPLYYYTGLGVPYYCDEEIDYYGNMAAKYEAIDPAWGFLTGWWGEVFTLNDGYCADMGADGCCDEVMHANKFVGVQKCSSYHLFFSFVLDSIRCHELTPSHSIMGLCFSDGPQTEDLIVEHLSNETIGGPQDRTVTEIYHGKQTLVTDELPDRAAGEIVLKCSDYYQKTTNHLTLPSICNYKQTYTWERITPYPFHYYMAGAYVPDSAAEDDLTQDKYFSIFSEQIFDIKPSTKTQSFWNFDDPPGYGTDGIYNQGIPASLNTSATSIRSMTFVADVNGEQVELENRVYEDDYPWFILTDAHILTCLGDTYYMYCYFVWEGIDSVWTVTKVQYGYFKNDINTHIQSQAFVPEGFMSAAGRKTVHHDVLGSKDFKTPLYGIGKCAGFLIKTTEEV